MAAASPKRTPAKKAASPKKSPKGSPKKSPKKTPVKSAKKSPAKTPKSVSKSIKKSPKKEKKEKATKDKVKDPNAPKRATTAYFFFLGDNRAKIIADHKLNASKVAEVAKKGGEVWGAMSDAEKAPYVAKADADKQRYEREVANYTPDESQFITKKGKGGKAKKGGEVWGAMSDAEKAPYVAKADADKQRYEREVANYTPDESAFITKKGKGKKAKKDKDAPKRGMSGFMFFMNANRAKIMADHKLTAVTEVGKKGGELWGKMSDAEKQPFQDQAAKDRARYEAEMAAYTKA